MTAPGWIVELFAAADVELTSAVREAINRYGVPTTLDTVDEITSYLLMEVVEQRRYLHSREAEILREQSPLLVIPPPRFYPYKSLHTLVRQSSGLTPSPRLARVELYDSETQRVETKSVVPWTEPDHPEIVSEFERRLVSTAGQHSRAPAREIVLDTARANGNKWARRMGGSETCAWCAYQAARGAVFSKESVQFEAHPNCDCYAVMVTGDDWDGKSESQEYARLLKRSKNVADFNRKYREKYRDEHAA